MAPPLCPQTGVLATMLYFLSSVQSGYSPSHTLFQSEVLFFFVVVNIITRSRVRPGDGGARL